MHPFSPFWFYESNFFARNEGEKKRGKLDSEKNKSTKLLSLPLQFPFTLFSFCKILISRSSGEGNQISPDRQNFSYVYRTNVYYARPRILYKMNESSFSISQLQSHWSNFCWFAFHYSFLVCYKINQNQLRCAIFISIEITNIHFSLWRFNWRFQLKRQITK